MLPGMSEVGGALPLQIGLVLRMSRGWIWSSARATRNAKDRMESRVAAMTQAWLTSNDFVADWVYSSRRLKLAFDEFSISTMILTRLVKVR